MSVNLLAGTDGRHLARFRGHRPRAYAPTSNNASHYHHNKIDSWVPFAFLYGCRAPLRGPPLLKHLDYSLSNSMNDIVCKGFAPVNYYAIEILRS